MLSQCDSCDKWFHPNCVNAFLVSQSASKSIESFHCPICLHMVGRPSNYAYKPNSEWKFNHQINSNNKHIIQKNAIKSVSKKDTTGVTILCNSKDEGKGAGVSKIKAKDKVKSKSEGKGEGKILYSKSSDPLTLMDLKEALERGNELRISQVSTACILSYEH